MGRTSLAGAMWPPGNVIPAGEDPAAFESHGGIRYRRSVDPLRTPALDVPRPVAPTGVDPLSIRLSTLHQAPVLSAKMVFPRVGMAALSPCAVGPRDYMVKPGERAPSFSVTGPDGVETTLASLQGRPVALFMVRILSTQMFCPMCVPGLEQMDALIPEFERRGVHVVVVGSTTLEHCRQFADALGTRYPIHADPEWHVFKAYGAGRLGSLPLHAWALIDAQGVLGWVWRLNGPDAKAALPMPAMVLDRVDELLRRRSA